MDQGEQQCLETPEATAPCDQAADEGSGCDCHCEVEAPNTSSALGSLLSNRANQWQDAGKGVEVLTHNPLEPKLHLRGVSNLFEFRNPDRMQIRSRTPMLAVGTSNAVFLSTSPPTSQVRRPYNSNCACSVLLSTKTQAFNAIQQFATRNGPGPSLYISPQRALQKCPRSS